MHPGVILAAIAGSLASEEILMVRILLLWDYAPDRIFRPWWTLVDIVNRLSWPYEGSKAALHKRPLLALRDRLNPQPISASHDGQQAT